MILNKIFLHYRVNHRILFRNASIASGCLAHHQHNESKRLLSATLKSGSLAVVDGAHTFSIQSVRHKYSSKKTSKNQDEDEGEDTEDDTDENMIEDIDKNTKIIKCSVNSLRADLILKSGLGLARNKVETIFYDSKIRINGRKLLKKCANLKIGDEIDVVKGKSTLNPDDIVVARIEILEAVAKNESIYVTLKRFKSLQIQNYDKDPISV